MNRMRKNPHAPMPQKNLSVQKVIMLGENAAPVIIDPTRRALLVKAIRRPNLLVKKSSYIYLLLVDLKNAFLICLSEQTIVQPR